MHGRPYALKTFPHPPRLSCVILSLCAHLNKHIHQQLPPGFQHNALKRLHMSLRLYAHTGTGSASAASRKHGQRRQSTPPVSGSLRSGLGLSLQPTAACWASQKHRGVLSSRSVKHSCTVEIPVEKAVGRWEAEAQCDVYCGHGSAA